MKRTILITGATSGIGKSTTKQLLEEGHTLITLSRRQPTFTHKNLHSYQIDLTDPMLELKLKSIQKTHPNIDTIICNAGKGLLGSLEEYSSKQIKSLIDLNFTSQAILIKQFFPHLKKQKRADIIFIGSIAALQGKKKGSIYCASKFALRGFAQALREESLNTSIKVSMIQPGIVNTPFYDNLMIKPKDDSFSSLDPNDISSLISIILNLPKTAVLEEITISSQKKHISLQKKDF